MRKNNATCQHCGKPYYVCRSCEDIHSWKNVACSVECFRALMEKKNKPTSEEKKPVVNTVKENNVEEVPTEEVTIVDNNENIEVKKPTPTTKAKKNNTKK